MTDPETAALLWTKSVELTGVDPMAAWEDAPTDRRPLGLTDTHRFTSGRGGGSGR